jgi:hypothetical protein
LRKLPRNAGVAQPFAFKGNFIFAGNVSMRRTSLKSENLVARRRLLAFAAAMPIAVVLGSGVHAQLLQEERPTRVNLTLEQRHTIKELVKELKTPSAAADAPTAIGAKVPDRIVTQPIPVEVSQKVPQVRLHAFYLKGDNIVLVDPKSRVIADVIN